MNDTMTKLILFFLLWILSGLFVIYCIRVEHEYSTYVNWKRSLLIYPALGMMMIILGILYFPLYLLNKQKTHRLVSKVIDLIKDH